MSHEFAKLVYPLFIVGLVACKPPDTHPAATRFFPNDAYYPLVSGSRYVWVERESFETNWFEMPQATFSIGIALTRDGIERFPTQWQRKIQELYPSSLQTAIDSSGWKTVFYDATMWRTSTGVWTDNHLTLDEESPPMASESIVLKYPLQGTQIIEEATFSVRPIANDTLRSSIRWEVEPQTQVSSYFGTITVPAGTFADCLLIEQTLIRHQTYPAIVDPSQLINSTDYAGVRRIWLAPGVGPIRTESTYRVDFLQPPAESPMLSGFEGVLASYSIPFVSESGPVH